MICDSNDNLSGVDTEPIKHLRQLASFFLELVRLKTAINTEMQLQTGPPELIKKRIANKKIELACIPKAKTLSEQSLNRFRVWKSGRKNIKPIISKGKICKMQVHRYNSLYYYSPVSDNYHDNVRDEEGHSSIIEKPPNVNSACKNTLDGV